MHLSEYQIATQKTARYPGQTQLLGVFYTTIKLSAEAGEVGQIIAKALRDDGLVTLGDLSDNRREQMKEELGDVLWYVAQIAKQLGYSLDDVATDNLAKLAKRYAGR